MCIIPKFISCPLERWFPGQNVRSEIPSLFFFPRDDFLPPISVSWVYLACFAGHTIRVAHVFIYSVKQESSKNITSPFMATFQTAGLSAFSASDGEVTAHWSGGWSHHVPSSPQLGCHRRGKPLWPLGAPLHIQSQRSLQVGMRERRCCFQPTLITGAFQGCLLFFSFFTTPLSPLPRLLIQLCNLPNA